MDFVRYKKLRDRSVLFTESRKDHFESKLHRHPDCLKIQQADILDLHRNCIPRYLFRTWHSQSGGGPSCTINDETKIVPHLFMSDPAAPDFYNLTEKIAKSRAKSHYYGSSRIDSGFSSWVASLHLVLCFARSLTDDAGDVHVAVIDTQDLNEEVHVWQCTHLFSAGYGRHEYLAYGPIRGRGYKAVGFADFVSKGLFLIIPHLNDGF